MRAMPSMPSALILPSSMMLYAALYAFFAILPWRVAAMLRRREEADADTRRQAFASLI